MTKRLNRRSKRLRILLLLLLACGISPGPALVNEVAGTAMRPAEPLSKHTRWSITHTKQDAQEFIMESITSGRAARVLPGFAHYYQRYLAGDTTALRSTEFSWDAAAEYLDEAIRSGS